jgi:hypothetical protein
MGVNSEPAPPAEGMREWGPIDLDEQWFRREFKEVAGYEASDEGEIFWARKIHNRAVFDARHVIESLEAYLKYDRARITQLQKQLSDKDQIIFEREKRNFTIHEKLVAAEELLLAKDKRIGELESALEFYADEKIYDNYGDEILTDGGDRARLAMKKGGG